MPTPRRALILGGTGAIGSATALRLARDGWQVDVTARDAQAVPSEFAAVGVRFHQIDRADTAAITDLAGDGSDLLVDLVAYDRPTAATLRPLWDDVESIVVMSSRAVYVDEHGRHINGDESPEFAIPLPESNRTLAPASDDVDPFSREGYAPAKVAIERFALDSGRPVSVIRPSKVHGRYARNARTTTIVEQMLAGAERIHLADGGMAIDHLTAAENTAALIATIADHPGARVLNSADPDPLTAREIVQAIANALEYTGRIMPLAAGAEGGEHPWNAAHPIILDTTASLELGYVPAGAGRDLIANEALWVASITPVR